MAVLSRQPRCCMRFALLTTLDDTLHDIWKLAYPREPVILCTKRRDIGHQTDKCDCVDVSKLTHCSMTHLGKPRG